MDVAYVLLPLNHSINDIPISTSSIDYAETIGRPGPESLDVVFRLHTHRYTYALVQLKLYGRQLNFEDETLEDENAGFVWAKDMQVEGGEFDASETLRSDISPTTLNTRHSPSVIALFLVTPTFLTKGAVFVYPDSPLYITS